LQKAPFFFVQFADNMRRHQRDEHEAHRHSEEEDILHGLPKLGDQAAGALLEYDAEGVQSALLLHSQMQGALSEGAGKIHIRVFYVPS
jgi:hypothetical protein